MYTVGDRGDLFVDCIDLELLVGSKRMSRKAAVARVSARL